MTITTQRLLDELGHRAWSGFNRDDMVFGSDDALQAQTELNFAMRYLMNLKDFPFRAKEQRLQVRPNISRYSLVDGQITNIYNANTRESLVFMGSKENIDLEATGTPTGYWVDYSNPDGAKLRIYPIPEETEIYNVVYNPYKPVMNAEGDLQDEFIKADDIMNMPENLEHLFMDCLVLRTMVTNNKDEQDENYMPTRKEFDEAWKVFTRACKPARIEHYAIF